MGCEDKVKTADEVRSVLLESVRMVRERDRYRKALERIQDLAEDARESEGFDRDSIVCSLCGCRGEHHETCAIGRIIELTKSMLGEAQGGE